MILDKINPQTRLPLDSNYLFLLILFQQLSRDWFLKLRLQDFLVNSFCCSN
jgi:hypothetical protein